uniref:Uncharacterized protein n=1 Tax=Vitis vinifera TaxID=29760 RepID=F6HVQ9_VITVI
MILIYFLYLIIRCNYLTYICFQPNGHWRLLTVPFLSHENSNLVGYGVQIGMNDFLLISPTPVGSPRARQQKEQRGSRHHDASSSAESSTSRNSSELDTNCQSASQSLANKATTSNEASCSDTVGKISNEFDAVNSSEALIDRSKAEKNARRNAKKKARRKEKRKEKLSMGNTGSTELEVLSEECAPESSTSETCTNNDMNCGDGPVSQETTPVDQLPDFQINENDSGGDSNSLITDCSETSEHPMSHSEDGIQTRYLGFSILKGPEEKHDEQLYCCDDMSAKGVFDMPDCVILDSVSAGHEAITEAGYDVNRSNLESNCVSLSQEICHTGIKECFSDQSSLNGVVTKFQTQECSSSDMQPVVPGKRDKQAKMLPQNGQERKENNPSVWQKVQRDGVSKCEDKSESKAEDSRRSNLGEEQSAVHSHTLSGCSKQELGSSSIIKKSIPMEKDPRLKILSRFERSILAHGDEPTAEAWSTQNNFAGEKSSSDSHKLTVPKKSELMCGAHGFGADSSKISGALNDSYRAQQQSEALQLATGSPIAEFERLISAATPAICQWNKVRICSTCSHEVNQPLCRNEIPKFSLRHLWKWYEKHGSYGLEVSSEEFSYSKRTGFHHSAFRAYFVPSLSAIQLIKALIGEGELSPNKMYGDPRKLDSMKLNKLHPRSWYSVAWYPIYRIPNGEHRASFLTYHSFSHLVCRSSTFGSKRMDGCMVSPVVGLQSYNAQVRWFLLKQFGLSQAGETPKLNPAEILGDRVQTLERAASVLARGEVSKGNLKFVNRHPDHEFFLSRRR